jgi:serine/threonine protein phosphatase PrpC
MEVRKATQVTSTRSGSRPLEIFLQTPGAKQKDFANALKQTFIKLDEQLKTPQAIKELKIYSPKEEPSSIFGKPPTDNISHFTGCTASVVLVTNSQLICEGDSRSVVCESGKTVDLSIDHKPDMPEEKARIEKAGGFVEENRVKGLLNLSRSIGDFEYKNDPKLLIEEQMVTVVPEIKTISRNPGYSFLIQNS